MITAGMVQNALRPSLGSALTLAPGFADPIASLLRAYAPSVDSFSDFSHRLEDLLFNLLYEFLGPGMTVFLDDGTSRRILLADLPSLADEALYPLFASLPLEQATVRRLQDWWITAGSWSALRALYLVFSSFLPGPELELIERIARENVPASRQCLWFAPKEDAHS